MTPLRTARSNRALRGESVREAMVRIERDGDLSYTSTASLMLNRSKRDIPRFPKVPALTAVTAGRGASLSV